MITPGYGLTATERVLPKLALDFTTASLDSKVSVVRALNTATQVNSNGFIETVNANLPRFDHTPAGVCKGLLIEESRINIRSYSEDFSNAIWVPTGLNQTGTPAWVNVATSPANTLTADKLISDTSFDRHRVIGQAQATSSGSLYTMSLFAKKSEYSKIAIGEFNNGAGYASFNVDTGTILTTGGSGSPTSSIEQYKDGWFRCIVTFTAGAFSRFDIYALDNAYTNTEPSSYNYTGDNSSGIFIWGADLELGGFATSYIPNLATGTTTRNADVVSMTGTNFSSWYTSSSAALAAVVIPSIATGTRPIWQLDDTTANEIIALRGNVANPELYIVDNGTPQAQLDAGTITANTQYGLCAAFTANSCAASQNGATPVTTATATMPTVTQARIGSDGSNFLNGAVKTLRYWPQRILNAETQAFSK